MSALLMAPWGDETTRVNPRMRWASSWHMDAPSEQLAISVCHSSLESVRKMRTLAWPMDETCCTGSCGMIRRSSLTTVST
ncbi:hypothetical protein DSECCO2_592360 [anaerobic digester metagenome]